MPDQYHNQYDPTEPAQPHSPQPGQGEQGKLVLGNLKISQGLLKGSLINIHNSHRHLLVNSRHVIPRGSLHNKVEDIHRASRHTGGYPQGQPPQQGGYPQRQAGTASATPHFTAQR